MLCNVGLSKKTSKKVKPPPDNLGTRHRALNTRVNDAFSNQINVDHAKTYAGNTDIDQLFMIDLAAKHKNADFIIETLKTGDSLYTARALKKCQWLFDDEYADNINPEYLYENVFPIISMRMKRKILKAAAKYITSPDRAALFYHCCMKEKMTNSAFISLIYTTDAFKIDVLRNKTGLIRELEKKDILYLRLLVKKSFAVLNALLDFFTLNWKIALTARQFKHLYYSVSNDKYLDLIEKYVGTWYGFQTEKFDAKLSDSIMKNHKDRVLSKPKFYINTVNTEVLVKYSTIDDLNVYAFAILPETGYSFWSMHYYSIYKPIFRIIPEDKIYLFFKNFFADNYPNTEFEMHIEFYKQKYYELMNSDQRHEWALCHLKSDKQILGVGNDYIWYKFVRFDVAFTQIKELISITKNAEKRNNMVEVLVESAQDNRDLESLLNYYHKRHLKELRSYKDIFLSKVISDHNVFKFDIKCWIAFSEVLVSMDLYHTTDATDKNINEKANNTYKTISVLYHILHEEPFPKLLMKYFLEEFHVNAIEDFLEDIDKEFHQKIHDFVFDNYMKYLIELQHKPHSAAVAQNVKHYFSNMQCSMATFQEQILDTPERSNEKKKTKRTRHISDKLSDRKLLRDLKKDKELVLRQLTDVKTEYEENKFKQNNFLKKIKIYFPDDIKKDYLKMFENLVTENKGLLAVKAGVHGIFDLADERVKIDLMSKYVPTGGKIDKKSIDIGKLRAQRAICQYACISRPPLPLSSMAMYMTSSYAKYCLLVFNTYLATVPLPICLELIQSVIDAPISIQKHAVRLAFKCFSTDILIKIISNIWAKTKNVSMRSVIYKALFNKVVDAKDEKEFTKIILKFTSSLHQDDENELFELTVSNKISEEFLGDYIEAVWEAVGSFDNKQPNITRKKNVIRSMIDKLHLLRKTFVLAIIRQHMDLMIEEGQIVKVYGVKDVSQLSELKWKLTARFIMLHTRSGSSADEYVEISQYIIKSCINKWNEFVNDTFVYQVLFKDFLTFLKDASLKHNNGYFDDGLPIFENVLSLVKPKLPSQDTYLIIWDLNLQIMTRKMVRKCKKGIDSDDLYEIIKEFSDDLRKLVTAYADSKTFFLSYTINIAGIIKQHTKDSLFVISQLSTTKYDDEDDDVDYFVDALLTFASGLVEIELPETYMLAVQLLPTAYDEEEEEFKMVFNKIHEYRNLEVQFSLREKFPKLCCLTTVTEVTQSPGLPDACRVD